MLGISEDETGKSSPLKDQKGQGAKRRSDCCRARQACRSARPASKLMRRRRKEKRRGLAFLSSGSLSRRCRPRRLRGQLSTQHSKVVSGNPQLHVVQLFSLFEKLN